MIRETFLLVAEVNGRIAGFANVEVESGLVDQLFVDPTAGGRGIATRLLTALEDHATTKGLTCLFSHASKRAIAVFEHCGYDRMEAEQVAIDSEVLERYLVRKSLA